MEKVLAVKQTRDWAVTLLEENTLLSSKLTAQAKLPKHTDVTEAMTEVVRFMWLCARTEGVLTPSVLVDDCWHEFILFTRSYHRFCNERLGKFIHHQPSANEGDNLLQYANTLELYRQVFGPTNNVYWPEPQHVNSCGTCED